jgi:hypothetical protein
MAYGDPQVPAEQQQQVAYDDPYQQYQYPGDMWAGRPPSDQSAQVRQAIFDCEIPKTKAEFQDWIAMMSIAIDAVARIPGVDTYTMESLNRKFRFIISRANSQGSKNITVSNMQEFLFQLRSLVATGDKPTIGLTGVGAMITTHTNQKQEVRYPVQQQASFGLLDWLPWRKRQ